MSEPIHSGHFMTSNPHSEIAPEEDDEDVEVDVVDIDDNTDKSPLVEKGRPDTDEKPVTFYKFGPQKTQSIAIDVSLNKLNKCIRIAYMKMTTPKWKDFKGLKLQWKHRIRLNNVIWRAFYMEFRKPDRKKKTPFCYFSVPDDDNTHSKLEGTVLEGMYWKRRMEGVCAQYKKWRGFNRAHVKKRTKMCCRKRENSCGCNPNDTHQMVPWFQPTQSQTPKPIGCDYDFDEFDNEFTDELFRSLNEPFLFPNPKESMQCGNADIMQPGLLSLQPSIEEILMSEYQFPDFQSQDDGYGMDTMESPTTPMPPSQSRQQQRQQQQQQQQAQNSQMQSSYSSREYDAAHMLVNYSNQPRQRYSSEPTMSPQPPRQSPSVPPTNLNVATQPLFSVAVQPLFSQAQPLYSQAIYEPVRTTPNPITTRNSYMEAQNTVQNGQPFFERSRQPMTSNTNDYVPQILAAAGISSGATMTSLTSIGPTFSMSTSVAPFQIPNNNLAFSFRSQPGISNIVSQPQSSQQQWWMNLQTQPSQQIQYQQPERRTFQTLQNVQTSPLQSPDASSSNPPSFRQQIPQPQGLVPSQLLNLQQPQQPQKIATKDAQYQYSPSLNLSQYLTPQSAQQIQSSLTNILTNNSSPFYSPSASTSNPLDEARQMPPPKLPRHNQPQVAPVKNPGDLYSRPLISIATSGSISPPTTLDARPNIPNSMLLSPTESFSAPKPLSSAPVPQRRSSLTTALTTPLQETIATQEYAKRSPPPQLETTPISPEQPSGSSALLDMPIKSESPFSGAMLEPKKPQLIPSGSKRRSSKSVPADSTLHPEERKRILHLHAEKNRRCALKDGFDQLLNAIPAIDEAGIKATNAVVLNHAATYIRGLKDEQEERNQEIDAMKEKINGINAKIALLQSNLPSNRRASTSTTPSMTNQIEQFSERYTKDRSRRDYRFWLMSQMMRPLVQSFATEIHQDQHSPERVLSSAREWLNRHWNAAELRPLASEMLLYLATETGALTNPNALSEHIIKEINKPS